MNEPPDYEEAEAPERVPPNDLDAEAAVVSAMLQDEASIDIVSNILRPVHFYADAHRHICQAIYTLRDANQKVDVVSVATWLRDREKLGAVGGARYLAQIVDATPAVAHVDSHARLILQKWRVRATLDISHAFVATAYQPVEDPQALLENFEQQIADIAHLGRETGLEPVRDIVNAELKAMAEAREDGSSTQGISTGLKDLDVQMGGGLFRTDLVILAARPGLGKTALATTISCNVARPKRGPYGTDEYEPGYAVASFTLEIGRDQLAMRTACHEAEVCHASVRNGRIKGPEWTKLLEGASALGNFPLWIDDKAAISLLELRGRVRQLKRQIENGTAPIKSKGLFLVVVDYLQLMTGRREKGDTREREVAMLSGGLKAMAKEEDVCVLALSQLNRAVERDKNKRPTLSSLRESGAIEQDADKILFIYREHYYDRSFPNQNQAEIDVAKNRNGGTGTVEAYFDPEPMRFHNAAKGDYQFDDGNHWDN